MLDDNPAWLDRLEFKKAYLKEWLDGARKINEVASHVQKNLDYTDWQLGVVQSRPHLNGMPSLPDFSMDINLDVSNLKRVLPVLQVYLKPEIENLASVGSALMTGLIDYAGQVSQLDDPAAAMYVVVMKTSLEKLNSVYKTVDELRDLIRKLGKSGLDDRFDTARASYEGYRVGTTDEMATANNLRTFLYGVRGELLDRAKEHPKENMTWELMSQRLAPESPHYEAVLYQKETFSRLFGKLSDVAKDRKDKRNVDLEAVWLEMQSSLMAIMHSISL